MLIFERSGLRVTENGAGGVTFSGAASLSSEDVAALVEALRRWKAGSPVAAHFERFLGAGGATFVGGNR